MCISVSQEAFSGGGGHFGFGTCTGLSMPHARKTWRRSCTTRSLQKRDEIFNKDAGVNYRTVYTS